MRLRDLEISDVVSLSSTTPKISVSVVIITNTGVLVVRKGDQIPKEYLGRAKTYLVIDKSDSRVIVKEIRKSILII